MATINTENAKQIRQPMDVIIKVTIEESANLTYTHSNTAKIADDVLDEPDWAMRKLADLQGDGFELDSSANVYDRDVPPSLSNGKIGVRTVVAAPVIITVTSDAAINYITVKAAGVSYVTYDNVDYSLTSGYAIIPVGGQTNFSMEFVGESIYKRVEVSDILPGIWLEITNENLISAVVSLRSDLSIIEPTLPESEINVEAYYDDDISEILAAIPDETPLTYQAGYPGDMSPVRKFYISDQITWADNVISIHAVDAVHKLDEEIFSPLNVQSEPNTTRITMPDLTGIYHSMCYMIGSVGIDFDGYVSGVFDRPGSDLGVGAEFVIKKGTRREILAALMNLLHIDFASGVFDVIDSYWPTYVDAGIPTLNIEKPAPSYIINEIDCGDVKRTVDRGITGIDLSWETISADAYYSRIIGSATMQKNSGVFVQLDSEYTWRYHVTSVLDQAGNSYVSVPPIYDGVSDSKTAYQSVAKYGDNSIPSFCCLLLGPDLPKGVLIGPPNVSSVAGYELFTQVMPWNSGTTSAWNNIPGLDPDTETMDVDIYGQAFEPIAAEYSYGTADRVISINGSERFLGVLYTRGKSGSGMSNTEVFPELAYQSLLSRSNVTGSFRWKGDPRMQPRDVVTFHRMDGSTEEITLENITLTHEGGGTIAEITYRKGVV